MKTLTIGREEGNDIILNDTFISRRHAELSIYDDGKVAIKDLNSSNGTFVNGNRINQNFLIPGDVVKCASTFLDWQPYATQTKSAPKKEPIADRSAEYKYESSQNQSQSQHQQFQGEKKLYISSWIANNLPAMVRNELASLSAQKQEEFVEEYKRKRKSVGVAYLFLIIIFAAHYGYLNKWGMQFLFWFTAGGLGIWWLIDLFRLSGLVGNYNKDVAVDVIRNLKAISQ